MADKMRWRYGDTNPVVAAVARSTVIEIGDLLWHDTNQAKPVSAQPDHGADADNQETLADSFLGVAMQRSRSGDTAPIRVATTGVFEFDCPPQSWELGDLIGVDVYEGLFNQQVNKVASDGCAIGRCGKRADMVATVLVDIRSTVMTGGVVSRK